MNIHKYEVLASFVLWIGAVLYAVYGVIKTRKAFESFDDIYGDFKEGWLVKTVNKDVADYEWETSLKIIQQAYPWFTVHIVISEYLRYTYIKILPWWQSIIALLFMMYSTGITGVIIILTQPAVFECVHKLKSKLLVWICGGVCLILICYIKSLNANEEHLQLIALNETQHYMIVVAACWINLRCLSYYLDHADFVQHNRICALSYCLYLPTLFLGPFIFFSNFENSQKSCSANPLNRRISRFLFNIARFGMWFIFTEFSLHYVYANALSFQPELIKSLDNWSLYGYGYCMGQFFHLKYVVLYGFSTTLSAFEHIITPAVPKCIGRIHLYSDMWKYFDQGLHKFLVRYIYLPTRTSSSVRSKMCSSFLCFLFVYVWHGIQPHILVWTTLNFIGICLENVCARFNSMLQFYVRTLDPGWKNRLHCVIAAPLLAMSAASNFYFFAGMQIGNIFVERFLQSSLPANIILLFLLCCCCYVSAEVKKWEASFSNRHAQLCLKKNS